MAKNTKLAVEKIAQPIVETMGYVYVDMEYAKQGGDWVLTLCIDKDGGVLLEDCEAVSRAVEAALDEADPISESYYLCVSSPGLDRPLKTARDFERSLGKIVDVKLYKPFEGKKLFTGSLAGYTDSTLTIITDDEEIVFTLDEAAKISLHLEL